MPRLFHYSEDASIARFEPRPVTIPSARPPGRDWLNGPLVWAIAESHSWMYLVPRDCPRACFWAGEGTTAADREGFVGGGNGPVMMLESRWRAVHEAATVVRYEFDPAGFEAIDATAGHFVAREAQSPMAVETLGDLPARIRAFGVELRYEESLRGPWREVIASTLEFSGTRLRNCWDGKP